MLEIKYAMSIIRGKLKNADEHNLHYQRFSIADMEAILGVLSKSESDYAALQQKLELYSMSAGQVDQFAAEAKSLRKALGFAEDAQDVAPIDLLEKIAGLRAEGVERFIHESVYEIPHRIKCGLMNYANQLRSGTHDTADKAG